MRIKLTTLALSLFCGVFMLINLNATTAQTADSQVFLKFYHQENGKIATINALNQKVFNFEAIGLKTAIDVTAFKNKFIGREGVVSISIDAELINDERNGSITFEAGTKGSYVRDILIKAGITQVYIDGVLRPVEELGKDK